MVNEPELLPCPFCGGRPIFSEISDPDDESFGGEFISCVECIATTDLRFSLKEDAKPLLAEAWNRRAPNPRSALLDRLAEALRQADSDFLDCGRQFMSLAERGVSTSGVSRSDLCGRYAARCAASVALIRAAIAEYDAMKAKGE